MRGLLIAGSVALIVAMAGTPLLIGYLHARGIGQQIRDDGPKGHTIKAGTPTMGGLIIVAATVVAYLLAHVKSGAVFQRAGVLVIFAVAGNAGVGMIDDWVKVSRQRSLGLSKRAKMAGQLVVALTFALLAVYWAHVRTDLAFARDIGVELSDPVYVVWAVVVIIAAANAVNLADGLDGLAAGSSAFTFAAFVFIGFWQFRHPADYNVHPALDLALVAAAMAGSCAGFLWWNAAPARIFMGDTGSLAIGAGLGALALTTNTHLLLPIAGGLFVLVTLSVVIQVAAFQLLHRRVFRMAPLHHHFELIGWPETTVIIRFWILAALFTAMAMGIFYLDWVAEHVVPPGLPPQGGPSAPGPTVTTPPP